MPVASRDTLNELSTVIGELRNFAAQQSITNTHIVDELKKISERMAGFGEVGATFLEYRKTLHERFGKIHEQIGNIDISAERLQTRVKDLEMVVNGWKANWKVGLTGLYIITTITSALMTTYGSVIIRALTHG